MYTALATDTITKIFNDYKLGNPTEPYREIDGDVDKNFKVTTDKGIYLLKYIQNDASTESFEFLGTLHKYLRSKNIPVPHIYLASNNKYVKDSCILYEFIDGEIKKEWSPKEIVSLTENFAHLHQSLRTYQVPDFIKKKDDKYIRGSDIRYCHDVLRSKILLLPTTKTIINNIIETIDILYGIISDFESLPKSLIHGDLNESNGIFKNNKNIAIIDFALSYNPIVYDLGVLCYWYAYPWWTNDIDKYRYTLMVNTFEKIIPLYEIEKKLLPYMMLRRSMMDIMLSLDYYWTQKPSVPIPAKRLKEQITHNKKIIEFIKSQEVKKFR